MTVLKYIPFVVSLGTAAYLTKSWMIRRGNPRIAVVRDKIKGTPVYHCHESSDLHHFNTHLKASKPHSCADHKIHPPETSLVIVSVSCVCVPPTEHGKACRLKHKCKGGGGNHSISPLQIAISWQRRMIRLPLLTADSHTAWPTNIWHLTFIGPCIVIYFNSKTN
jgi:hypothetical protein